MWFREDDQGNGEYNRAQLRARDEQEDRIDQAYDIIKAVALFEPMAFDECAYCMSVEQDDGTVEHLETCIVYRARKFMENIVE